MRSYTPTLLLLFAFLAGTSPLAFSQSTGQCLPGGAEKDLDVNNVLARVFNTGSLFFGNTTTAGNGYLVPKASGHSPIFASGIWMGGMDDGDLRVAGSTYDDFEFWPGPLNDDGTLPNPTNCGEFDRIWKVSRLDIQNFEATGTATADLATWPAELGAPVIAAPGNGFDDDGDGLTDEGTDGVSNDDDNGDGIICPAEVDDSCLDDEEIVPDLVDERDEQERVVPSVRQAAGLPIYNLNGGDRPEIIGDQGLWWVMNDVGNVHANTLSPPLGVEVQVLAFSFARADALNDITFYRYKVVKKSPGTLSETYFSIFSDPDLGDATDDFVGVDTTLSLGFVYNEGDIDATYGIPPATGYDFFQGPIVDPDGDGVNDTLGVTRYGYFTNVQGTPTSDPSTADGIYNFMQGLWKGGEPMTEGGNGYQTNGPLTLFAFPGDPVTDSFWSEVNVDGSGTDNPSDDRRFLVTTGPFDLAQGDEQTIVFGIVFGQGSDKLNSITVMRQNDALAQAAFDADFELASAPPPPQPCDPTADLDEDLADPNIGPENSVASGSGNCFEAVELSGQAELVWGYPVANSNYLGGYEVFDQLLAQQDAPDKTYNFEGFNIYRYPNGNFEQGERELLATYDVINGVTTVIDTMFSPAIGDLVPFTAPATLMANDTGIRYSYDLSGLNLINHQDYFFGITAYAYNFYSVPKVIESSATQITVRPSNIAASGTATNAALGQGIAGTRSVGAGLAALMAQVVDPTQEIADSYSVEIVQIEPDEGDPFLTFRILRDGEVAFDGVRAFNERGLRVVAGEQRIIVDGIEFFSTAFDPTAIPEPDQDSYGEDGIPDFAGDGAGIVEVAAPDGSDPCDGDAADSIGCEIYGGNTVWLDPNSTGDYLVTSAGGSLGDSGLGRYVSAAAPDDFEMRFTEDCASFGNCLGIYDITGNGEIVSVPFEIYNVGDVSTPDDDIRMIPVILADGGDPVVDWADYFGTTQEVTVNDETVEVPITDRVYWVMPDRRDGYDLFEQAAGAPGTLYPYDNDPDTQEDIDPATGDPCPSQGVFIDFCYKGAGSYVYPIGRFFIGDFAMDGTTPGVGTVIRILTVPKPELAGGDVVTFNTAGLGATTNVDMEAQLDEIGIVPNPYMGRSGYESGNLDRVVRFINLPDQATISIYTVSGTLIRTLQKDGPSRSLDWDLNTHNQLPVASGMYLIHVDVPGVGERVLKFGVVNRRNRITVF